MAKVTRLFEFEKGEITALKRVGKSQREISKALRHRKTVICNYLKSPDKYGTRKQTGRPEKFSPQFERRIVRAVKKSITQQGPVEEDPFDLGVGGFSLQESLKYNLSVVNKKQQMMWWY